jgi:hypothetical protein
MPKKRMPADERQEEGGSDDIDPCVLSYNSPDTGGCPARKGADVGRWTGEVTDVETTEPAGMLDAVAQAAR